MGRWRQSDLARLLFFNYLNLTWMKEMNKLTMILIVSILTIFLVGCSKTVKVPPSSLKIQAEGLGISKSESRYQRIIAKICTRKVPEAMIEGYAEIAKGTPYELKFIYFSKELGKMCAETPHHQNEEEKKEWSDRTWEMVLRSDKEAFNPFEHSATPEKSEKIWRIATCSPSLLSTGEELAKIALKKEKKDEERLYHVNYLYDGMTKEWKKVCKERNTRKFLNGSDYLWEKWVRPIYRLR